MSQLLMEKIAKVTAKDKLKYYGKQALRGAAIGAGIGGGFGLGSGLVSKKDVAKGTLRGAGVGGGAGALSALALMAYGKNKATKQRLANGFTRDEIDEMFYKNKKASPEVKKKFEEADYKILKAQGLPDELAAQLSKR